MWRRQTALGFWGVYLAGGLLASLTAIRAASADEYNYSLSGPSPDFSLIGFDGRGVQQAPEDWQSQPCQTYVPCPAGFACQCNSASEAAPTTSAPTASGPLMLTIGPPPRLYSPSADFSAHVGATPGWTVVGDDSAPQYGLPPASAVAASNSTWTAHSVSAAPPCPPSISIGYPALPAPMPPTIAMTPPMPFIPGHECSTISVPPGTVLEHRANGFIASFPQVTTCPSGANCACVAGCNCANTACGTSCDCASADQADKLDHLLEAIHHLDAAGMHYEADQFRSVCDAQMKSVVEQLQTAQAELARLHQAAYNQTISQSKAGDSTTEPSTIEEWMNKPTAVTTSTAPSKPATVWSPAAKNGSQKQVKVNVQLLEVSRTKCQALGFDFSKFENNHFEIADSASECFDNDSSFLTFLNLLKKEGLATVVCAPQIQARSGQLAQIEVGQEVPVLKPQGNDKMSIEYKKIGTSVEVLPEVLENQKLRLHLKPCYSELEQSSNFQSGGCTTPWVSTTELETTLEMKSGQTAVLGGLVINRQPIAADASSNCGTVQTCQNSDCACQCESKPAEKVELLFVVRAEIIDSNNTTKTVDLPTRPVVTAALPEPKSSKHFDSIIPAAYFEPVNDAGAPASHEIPNDCFAVPTLPEPFAPQPITIGAIQGLSPFDNLGGVKPKPAPFESQPIQLGTEPSKPESPHYIYDTF